MLRELGIRTRRNVAALPGTPDFANQRRRIAVFVHGCFWHAHRNCSLAKIPKTNRAFWIEKLAANRSRDKRKAAELRKAGYRVVTLWQCDGREGYARKLSKLVSD